MTNNWGSGAGGSNDFSLSFPDEPQDQLMQQQFETFDYGTPVTSTPSSPQQQNFYSPPPAAGNINNPYGAGPIPTTADTNLSSAPSYFLPGSSSTLDGGSGVGVGAGGATGFDGNFEDEPPLLEELGINPYHIFEKTLSVLNPMRKTDATILQDTDLAGPMVFCVMFGFILLLSGKVHFGYIYGIGVISCVAMYFLLNMMSVAGVSIGVTISVLGYCLLPMVGLAGVNLLLSLQGYVGTFLTVLAVLWCSLSASKLFVTALGMQKQQPLVAYPCALLYGVFALLAVF